MHTNRRAHDAHDTDDLYTTLGYTLANETAKAVNKRDISHLLEATECISKHSSMQADSLLKVYAYLGEINSLHSQLKLQKETTAAEQHAHDTIDAYSNFQQVLQKWNVGEEAWTSWTF